MSVALMLISLAAAEAEPPIVVTAARAPVGLSEFGGSVTILDAADIERLQVPLLLDVLRLQPGIGFSRNGGPGGFTAVRIRGAEGEQTTVVIDGVKVADPAAPGGGYDFAQLSVAQVERVEILRGPQSLAWGSQAIGGVISVETEGPTEDWRADALAEGGTRGTAAARGSVSGRIGRLGLSIGANGMQTDGISAFAESRGGTERDDFGSWGVNARGEVRLLDWLSADLRGRFQQSDFGIDGFPPPAFSLADTPERTESREIAASVGLVGRGTGWRARVVWQISDIDRTNLEPGATPEATFRSNGRLTRWDGRGEWDVSRWLSLSAGAEHEVSRLETAFPSAFDPDPVPETAEARLTGGFGQAVLRPVPGLTLLGGVRHDHHSIFGGATTLGGSLSYAPKDGPFRVKASYGEGFKAPTLFQLESAFGNPGLAPERAAGWDVGAEYASRDGRARVGATWYSRVTQDQIIFVSCFQNPLPACAGRPFGTYDNVARTTADGIEVEGRLEPVDGLVLGANFSWLVAENATPGSVQEGNRLPRRPEHSMSVLLDWTAPAGWSLGATLAHVSGSFDDAANLRPIEGRVLVDLRASVPLGRRFALYGRVTNLFDEVYETASFYGQPGREAAVGLRAAF
jgi:vitamin B12 transporter